MNVNEAVRRGTGVRSASPSSADDKRSDLVRLTEVELIRPARVGRHAPLAAALAHAFLADLDR
jgi:hypothetical protein